METQRALIVWGDSCCTSSDAGFSQLPQRTPPRPGYVWLATVPHAPRAGTAPLPAPPPPPPLQILGPAVDAPSASASGPSEWGRGSEEKVWSTTPASPSTDAAPLPWSSCGPHLPSHQSPVKYKSQHWNLIQLTHLHQKVLL